MNGPLEWFAAIGAVIAAAMIAADIGRRATGWAFVLFSVVAIAWVIVGLTGGGMPLTIQNAILLIVNLWGVWQYLLSPKNKRKIEKMEEIEKEAEHEVETS
ncbi:hypothetical protein GRI38_04195 [Altererythrobacter aurantiacus]|uniref:PRC-barrel domain-containing protein n=1 Tax=Parapontixanthobacter aurantiacus TaxID=1463599 RepID=A0A844ZDD3_9SPHN|nr:hypothetical protein [Parapontixanthobacter aurantiacus]MXO85223.1 hypothetical protein [Parapontixanthobacter aurantiacus]